MNLLFSWLMVLCVLAGLNVRAMGADHFHPQPSEMSADKCCGHDDAPVHPHDDGHHDGDCHHHHCCSQANPMAMDNDHFHRFAIPDSRRVGLRHEGEFPPEEPFLSSEKPPLI